MPPGPHVRDFADAGGSVLLTTHSLEEADTLASRIVVLHQGRVVAEGTSREIRDTARLARVRVTAAHLPPLPADPVVSRADGAFTILTSDPDAVVTALVRAGIDYGDVEIARAGLEDAFLDLLRTAE